MTKSEILQHIVSSHNRIAQITVNGDNCILMGDALRDLRILAKNLQAEIENEQHVDEERKELVE